MHPGLGRCYGRVHLAHARYEAAADLSHNIPRAHTCPYLCEQDVHDIVGHVRVEVALLLGGTEPLQEHPHDVREAARPNVPVAAEWVTTVQRSNQNEAVAFMFAWW